LDSEKFIFSVIFVSNSEIGEQIMNELYTWKITGLKCE